MPVGLQRRGRSERPSPRPCRSKLSTDSFSLIQEAASGKVEAQRSLAHMAFALAMDGDACDPYVTLMEGLCFARMAASRGDEVDKRRLLRMLSYASTLAERAGWVAASSALFAEGVDGLTSASNESESDPSMIALLVGNLHG